jgi:hypothetical protein
MRADLGFHTKAHEEAVYRHGVEATLTIIVNSGRLGEHFLERRSAT